MRRIRLAELRDRATCAGLEAPADVDAAELVVTAVLERLAPGFTVTSTATAASGGTIAALCLVAAGVEPERGARARSGGTSGGGDSAWPIVRRLTAPAACHDPRTLMC